jgi:uncharacterized protein
MNVLVTGATGLVGTALVRELRERGDTVIATSRDAERAKAKLPDATVVAADLETPGAWCEVIGRVDAIVHLAGESVAAKRWDAQQKQRIRDSRVESTRVLVEEIEKLPPAKRPKVLVSASGVDYYPYAVDNGLGDDDEVTESDPPAETFLGRVCRDWEKQAFAAEPLGVRVCCMRTGLVLAGEALSKLSGPFKWFVGGRIGSGKQWMAWIALSDTAIIYANAVHDERYRGPINLVTDSLRNRELAGVLGKALGRRSWLPVPAFAVKAAAGEFAGSVLNGRRVVPARLRELGYKWREPAALSTT